MTAKISARDPGEVRQLLLGRSQCLEPRAQGLHDPGKGVSSEQIRGVRVLLLPRREWGRDKSISHGDLSTGSKLSPGSVPPVVHPCDTCKDWQVWRAVPPHFLGQEVRSSPRSPAPGHSLPAPSPGLPANPLISWGRKARGLEL